MQGLAPGVEQAQHRDPEDAILVFELGALHAAAKDGDLLAQGEVLKHEALAVAERGVEHRAEDMEGVLGVDRSGRRLGGSVGECYGALNLR